MSAIMRKYRVPTLFLLGLIDAMLLLAGCVSKPAADPIVVPQGAKAGDLTAMTTCPYQAEGSKTVFEAECGTLTVPENWDKADSRLIALPIVRVPATGSSPSEPVFWLVGGPGGTNLNWDVPQWLLKDHDVVLMGYRGVDGSVKLDCPELGRTMRAHAGVDVFSEQARRDYVTAARQCAADLQSSGIDLGGYTIPGVIADLEAIRTALGYDRIDLFSESYGTRVAQTYAYMHPQSLKRVVQIGVNTPGHFIYDPATYDQMLGYLSKLCAKDPSCSSRTSDLAQTVYTVNRTMPRRWLFFTIDPGTVQLGTQFLLFSDKDIATIMDTYLAADHGDPSGLAMGNLIMKMMMPPGWTLGEYLSKGGPADLDKFHGFESVSLGKSIMGAPLSELVWSMVEGWPIQLMPQNLRDLQETNVEMLLVNGTLDFSTPPTALAEAKPYFHKAQMVLLPEFSHVGDVYTLQQGAFERLITSYYDTGWADSSLYVYQPLSFKPDMNLPVLAKALVAALIVVPALFILIVVLVVRRIRRRQSTSRSLVS